MNLFEIASRNKLRVPTTKGDLTVEQLWDLPLKSANGLSLDNIAIALNKQLESKSISFVDEVQAPESSNTKVLFDIVLYIISVRKAEAKQAQEQAAKRSQLKFLKELKDRKRLESFESFSEEEINKQIAELENQ
nr:MAG TPA: hypothetical protein [Caudoviricetes sp.]